MTAKKTKVLVVDDERVIADTLAIILNQQGYEATAVYTGTAAVDRARSVKPDLIISDVIMPGGAYRVTLVPPCRHLPLATLQQLLTLAESGATVAFHNALPKDVPGSGHLKERRGEFQKLVDGIRLADVGGGLQEARLGRGRILVGDSERTAPGWSRTSRAHPGACYRRMGRRSQANPRRNSGCLRACYRCWRGARRQHRALGRDSPPR